MERGHVLITGTGRAGTTLLVRIFMSLGLDTGFTQRNIDQVEERTGKAGLEHSLRKAKRKKLPEIIKSPQATDHLSQCLKEKWCTIDHVILPVRKLESAAVSRMNVQKQAGKDTYEDVAGGLWKADSIDGQLDVLAQQFFKVIFPLVEHEIPITFIEFPRFAKDPEYFVRALLPLLSQRYGLSKQDLIDAHKDQVKMDFITADKS